MSMAEPRPPVRRGRGPVVFEGFRTLYAGPYLAYARIHLGSRRAADVVRSTFSAVARRWPAVVSSRSPTAAAWEQLVAHTGSRQRPLSVVARSPLEYDVVVLHHVLGYGVGVIADVVGHHPSKVNYLVRAWPPAAGRRATGAPDRAGPATDRPGRP